MKRKTIALYDPYLDTLGGGEKHILSILKVLSEEGYSPTIFWNENYSKKIKERLNIHFDIPITFVENIFSNPSLSVLDKHTILSKYDILLYVTDGSYFFSGAKKNIVFSMVPNKELYHMNFMNKLKTAGSTFISNSQFTKNNLERYGIQNTYLYPYIEDRFINIDLANTKKDKIILSVGRFFKSLHAKRQDIMIESFLNLKKDLPELKEYKLVLAGGLQESDKPYFDELVKLSDNDSSIILKPNLAYAELIKMYEKSQIYWHFAGYEVDENKNPELTEHLGITPLEAMSAGCITVCYSAGGLKEIIKDNERGFLFSSYQELKTVMKKILSSNINAPQIQSDAKEYIKKTFSYPVFKECVNKVILEK